MCSLTSTAIIIIRVIILVQSQHVAVDICLQGINTKLPKSGRTCGTLANNYANEFNSRTAGDFPV